MIGERDPRLPIRRAQKRQRTASATMAVQLTTDSEDGSASPHQLGLLGDGRAQYSHPLARPASLCPRRRGGRDAIAIELRRYPVCLRFVVLVSGGALKGVFRGIHRQIPTSVLLRRMDGVERHCNVLRVHSEEATD
jgi:hypothetical protein